MLDVTHIHCNNIGALGLECATYVKQGHQWQQHLCQHLLASKLFLQNKGVEPVQAPTTR